MDSREMTTVDIVIPVYNEEECLPELARRLSGVMDGSPEYRWRVMLVENGSIDRSAEVIAEICSADGRFEQLSLVRNFGAEGGILAGMTASDADVTVTMQADLEDPPELIPQMLDAWRNGALYVYASVSSRETLPLWRRVITPIYYKLASWASDGAITPNASDYRLMDRSLREVVLSISEQNLFLRGVVTWAGFPSAAIPFERGQRYGGATKFRFLPALGFATRGMLAQSNKPLRAMTLIGAALVAASVVGLVYLVWAAFFRSVPFGGFGTIVGLQVLFFGLTMVFLGLVAEYIALIYREVRPRPHFVRRPNS